MRDGSLPITRFKATAEAFGWTKRTDSPAAIEKLCQLRMAFCEYWLISILLPLTGLIAALPPWPRAGG
jgi:hypothetical protein